MKTTINTFKQFKHTFDDGGLIIQHKLKIYMTPFKLLKLKTNYSNLFITY